jgi:hypothetical protein
VPLSDEMDDHSDPRLPSDCNKDSNEVVDIFLTRSRHD